MSHTTDRGSTRSTGPARRAVAHAVHRVGHVPGPRQGHDHEGVGDEGTATSSGVRLLAAGLRLALGWTFLWAFLDKTFGLGHETAAADAWTEGGSPTEGFLSFATAGPFADTYQGIAGAAWADWLFMIGLLGIGVALVLGVAMRIAVASGALMLVLMWTAVLPPANNPFMDDHLIYAGLLVLLAALGAGRTLGLGTWWESLPIVRSNSWLR
ncbi:DoxX family membrane protein [Nocardioides sp. HDW12B]|uniref:DoxX family membrane protein n=1 Tax=Nocardioides sp. HDW12B TaxID=2714939 RepID=UPI00140A7913|nr:DoxX family membrane protein [Nocardioides sp. HDW12B]QIK67236.1 DoxX family membrane protein [Nocardioides sp. HDW12B]